MTADQYLALILSREQVDTGPFSPVRGAQATVMPILTAWGGQFLQSVSPSGSFAKGTAVKSGTDIDLFISLHPNTPATLRVVHDTLVAKLRQSNYMPRLQNVSINIKVNGYSVDLVPGKLQNALLTDHSLYRRKAGTWTKTNIATHIRSVMGGGRQAETRLLKLWRNQKGLEFPSFYLELTTIEALRNTSIPALGARVWRVFEYLRDRFVNARVIDPANTNNIISDDLTIAEKMTVKNAAIRALAAKDW